MKKNILLILITVLMLAGCGSRETVGEDKNIIQTQQEEHTQFTEVPLSTTIQSGGALQSTEQIHTVEQVQSTSQTEVTEVAETVINDITDDSQSAQEFVYSMGYGWNLGNTLDPVDCTWVSNDLDYETAWGNGKTTRELIQFIKSEGFDTIRIPVTWTNHVGEGPDYRIREDWMNRVQEIVDWCMEEDMYIIINMHHESGWLTKASADYEGTMEKYKSIWTQIAQRFSNYSDKLLFESMNEIGFDDLGAEKGCELLNKINAEFVELIRSSGGQNGERYLLLAGYWTDIDSSCKGIIMPEDERVILSVHYYSPAEFAIAETGTAWGYRSTWGTDEDFAYLEKQMEQLKTCFSDKGIPIIMGEYGCIKKDKDAASRVLYLSTVAQYCRRYGICPIFWDNGEEIDRSSLTWRTEGLKDGMIQN